MSIHLAQNPEQPSQKTVNDAKRLSIFSTLQRHFSNQEKQRMHKNNKIVINNWQILHALFQAKCLNKGFLFQNLLVYSANERCGNMKTSKELTEQAFELYRRILNIIFFSHISKKLIHLKDRAFKRYKRRLMR